MLLITSAIAGFIAVGVATPAGLTAIKPTSTRDSVDAVPTQSTPVHTDGNWHIGCDANNYCSYYQDSDIAAGSNDMLPLRTVTMSETTCKQCTSLDPCGYCDERDAFQCRDCDHYYCHDEYIHMGECFDIEPELAEVVRNSTITATLFETATSTTVETSFAVTTVSSIEITTITVTTTTPLILPTPTSEPIVTITRTPIANVITHTIYSARHSGLAPRNVVVSNDADIQPPVRRNAAFTESQCVPCDAQTCPECHSDCASCEKFRCADPATHLTVCMSVRSKWQPPSFNISASAPSETTTVVVMPQPGTTTQTIIYSPSPLPPAGTISTVIAVPQPCTTVVAAPPLSQTTVTVLSQPTQTTVTVLPQPLQTSTVTVRPQPPQITTLTVVASRPSTQTHTISIKTSVVTVQMPASTVTHHYQDPASTVVYQQPGTTSTITYHYHDPASTVVIQGPTVTPPRTPTVLEIPMTMISTATHTVARSVRAVQTSVPMSPRDSAMAKTVCDTCDGNLECDGCNFACGEDCFHFLCKDAISGLEICMSIPEDLTASKAYDMSMNPGDFLGSAAMLLVLDDIEDPTSNSSASHIQPPISNATRPNFAFAEEDCYLCESDDESCSMCDWQFTCGTKKRCFHNGAREVVDMCFEQGEKCRP